ncbi:hypothetical protein [Jeotgalibacillus proteolyticus]|uniref:Uncharacterized protein n=1 Tax=Jeotgalibacillus proteolyticus TaxID=2082395 RepID=A0A2S5G9W8_9BACL|nr:hypothetical protein [Jeotgalibacillus proteolyticus]PPA69790.1 hypothetical protein C4B60_14740 [Jeotgalibacillus proteolyticus]
MLTFEEKLSIFESYPELTRKEVSLGRVNFHFDESKRDKSLVGYHIHPNGNGFIFGGFVKGYKKNDKGMINIREFPEEDIRLLIEKSIRSLSIEPQEELADFEAAVEETWANANLQTLLLTKEDDMWSVYAGKNLEGIFPSYNEAAAYLEEEGFTKKRY